VGLWSYGFGSDVVNVFAERDLSQGFHNSGDFQAARATRIAGIAGGAEPYGLACKHRLVVV